MCQALQTEGSLPEWVKYPDTDRCRWGQTLLRELWPFVNPANNEAIRALVLDTVNLEVRNSLEAMKTKQEPGFFGINSVAVESVDIGAVPPVLGGVKAHHECEDGPFFDVTGDFHGCHRAGSGVRVKVEFGVGTRCYNVPVRVYGIKVKGRWAGGCTVARILRRFHVGAVRAGTTAVRHQHPVTCPACHWQASCASL